MWYPVGMTEPERPEQPQSPTVQHDLAALYQQALETGEAGPLVRALLETYKVNLRGLAEVSGVHHETLSRWGRGVNLADRRTLQGLRPLIYPDDELLDQLRRAASARPLSRRGRPRKR